MGVLTLHHWGDWRAGLTEAMRVSGGRLVLLTWLGFEHEFWLLDYFPDIRAADAAQFPHLKAYEEVLGRLDCVEVPIPADCVEGFLCANWARPEAYLDSGVRSGISSFANIAQDRQDRALACLAQDLESREWDARHGALRERDACDFGYRLIVTGTGTDN